MRRSAKLIHAILKNVRVPYDPSENVIVLWATEQERVFRKENGGCVEQAGFD